jgi:ERCC4-type nuclease
MDENNVIIDVHEAATKTVLRCGCGRQRRDLEDEDRVGAAAGRCSRCGQLKEVEAFEPEGKIPLFPHELFVYLREKDIPFKRVSLQQTGGDYIIQRAKLVIERKTISDLIHTWLQGDRSGRVRLETQLRLCLNSYPDCTVALMIEDYYSARLDFARGCVWIPVYDGVKPSKRTGKAFRRAGYYQVKLNPKSLLGKLRALEGRAERAADDPTDPFDRLEVVRCSGAEHAVQWFSRRLAGTGESVSRGRRVKVNRIKRPFSDLRDKRLFFLEGLPEIGPATSKKLLDAYPTPLDALLDIGGWKDNPDLDRISESMVEEGKMVLGASEGEGGG